MESSYVYEKRDKESTPLIEFFILYLQVFPLDPSFSTKLRWNL